MIEVAPTDHRDLAVWIIRQTAQFCGVSEADILGPSKRREFALPRMTAAHLIRKHTGLPFAAIAEIMGRKEHTSIINADRRIAGLVELEREKEVRKCQ